jgi:hypothetical protein
MDGIFPVLLQEGRRNVFPYLVRNFRACLAIGYVPNTWRQVKLVFIPKTGWSSYTRPKNFRPVILISFLLRTMERLVERYWRDGALAMMPLHPNQHAYQSGKSVETPLHQLVVRIQKALDQQETAYLLTYLLTPWSRVLLEKLPGLQLVKKFPAFYGTRKFINVFTSARHLYLS